MTRSVRRTAAVLVRDRHQLQIGCDPERSVLVDLPPAVNAYAVTDLLDTLGDPAAARWLPARLQEVGLDRDDFDEIVRHLRAVGPVADSPPELRVCLHGSGPLREGLDAALTSAGYPLSRSSSRRARPWGTRPRRPTLVVLTDFALPDPVVVDDLMRRRIPHLPVLLRDGVGVVGPLVLPGRSSCLRCADHHRATLDPQWPQVSAQLVNRIGFAGEAVTRLTVGMAVEQLEQITAGLAQCAEGVTTGSRPDLVDRTVEIHSRPVRLRHKAWPAHPRCRCNK